MEYSYDILEFTKRVDGLISEQGLSEKALTKKLKISTTSFTDWRSGKARPTFDTVWKIAKYFDVTVEYLVENGIRNYKVRELEISKRLNELQKYSDLFELIDELPADQKLVVEAYIQGVCAANKTLKRDVTA